VKGPRGGGSACTLGHVLSSLTGYRFFGLEVLTRNLARGSTTEHSRCKCKAIAPFIRVEVAVLRCGRGDYTPVPQGHKLNNLTSFSTPFFPDGRCACVVTLLPPIIHHYSIQIVEVRPSLKTNALFFRTTLYAAIAHNTIQSRDGVLEDCMFSTSSRTEFCALGLEVSWHGLEMARPCPRGTFCSQIIYRFPLTLTPHAVYCTPFPRSTNYFANLFLLYYCRGFQVAATNASNL